MKKIKILYIIDYLSIGGGTENQLRKLIQHIDKDKFEVSVVVLKYLDWEGFPGFSDPGCPHQCLYISKLLSFGTIVKIFRLAGHIRKNKIDIIHTFFFDSNLIGVAAGILSRCRSVIVSRRDLGFWYTTPKLLLLRFFKLFSHLYVVNSHAIKQAVIQHEKITDQKIEIIYNGFFDFPDNSPSPISKEQLHIPDESFVVGIVANLRDVKRLDIFIQLADKLKTVNLYFLMLGNGPLKQSLLKQAEECGLQDRLQILHTLDNIFDYIKLFDIGVLTSSSEGLSNTLIEYQLCGKPAVAFDVGGNNEVIVQNKSGQVIPFLDIDAMAAVIMQLLNDKSKRQELGDYAKERATKIFSGSQMIASYEKMYNSQVMK